MSIKAIFCSVQNVGRHVKKTKKHFLWKFSVNGRDHIVELFVSMLSGKKKLKVNGRVVFEGQKVLSTSFTYPLEVDNQMLNIYQSGEKFELLINNQPFEHLYEDGRGHGYNDVTSNSYYRNGQASTSRNKFGRYNKNETLRVNEDHEHGGYGGRRYGDYDSNGYGGKADGWNDVNNKYSSRQERSRTEYDDDYSEGREGPNEWDDNRNSEYREYRRDDFDSFENHQNKYSNDYRMNSRSKTTGAAMNKFGEPTMPNHQRPQYNNNMKTQKFDNKENAFEETTTMTHMQVKRTFFDIDQAESVVQTQTQQRMALDTVAQQNMFEFGTTTVREEQTMKTVPVQQQQQNQWQQDQWQQQPQPQVQLQTQPQALSVVVNNDLLDLASESETQANNLTELYKQGPSPVLQMQIPFYNQLQTQAQPQLQLPYQSQPAPTEVNLMQIEPAKKDLWQTGLVHLSTDDLRPANMQQQAEPSFIQFNLPSAQPNMNYNYQPQPMQNNMNMNMGTYGTMNGFGMRA